MCIIASQDRIHLFVTQILLLRVRRWWDASSAMLKHITKNEIPKNTIDVSRVLITTFVLFYGSGKFKGANADSRERERDRDSEAGNVSRCIDDKFLFYVKSIWFEREIVRCRCRSFIYFFPSFLLSSIACAAWRSVRLQMDLLADVWIASTISFIRHSNWRYF